MVSIRMLIHKNKIFLMRKLVYNNFKNWANIYGMVKIAKKMLIDANLTYTPDLRHHTSIFRCLSYLKKFTAIKPIIYIRIFGIGLNTTSKEGAFYVSNFPNFSRKNINCLANDKIFVKRFASVRRNES